MSEPFEVLMVCTGNICRSPAAERLLRSALASAEDLVVRSAGTGALKDAGIDSVVSGLLEADGVSAVGHHSHWLTEADVRRADLVLGMESEHRSRAVSLFPPAVRRSFTMNGFAALAAAVPPDVLAASAASQTVTGRLRALIELAPQYRQLGITEDIDDPYRADAATYARVYDEIVQAVQAVAAAVNPKPVP